MLFLALFGPPAAASDCNGNGVDDQTDINDGTSVDCNGNDIPDECELVIGTGELGDWVRRFDESNVGTYLGSSLCVIGDLNNDGFQDIALGKPGYDAVAENAGAVFVHLLDGTAQTLSSATIAAGFTVGDDFGTALSPLGDLDADGVPDLIAGAPDDDDAGDNAGAAYVLFLNSDGSLKGQVKITESLNGFTGDLDVGDDFGSALAVLGDITGDGNLEVAIGAPDDDDDGDNYGALYIVSLAADGSVQATSKVSSATGGFSGPLGVGDHFGSALASLGDLDGDNLIELAVGAPYDDDTGENTGSVWILSIDNNGAVTAEERISASAGGLGAALDVGDHFGASLAMIGDHDSDGVQDLAVGAPGDDDGFENAGAVHILRMSTAGTVNSDSKISSAGGGSNVDLGVGDDFGMAIANAGDLNSDGIDDLFVGAPDSDDFADNGGSAWLLPFATEFYDCDGNGVPDECDPDCNANEIPDACDIAQGTSTDCNGNGLPDECEFTDCNANGISDLCDVSSELSKDCDGDWVPDECQILADPAADCDGDTDLDSCEIADDPFLDQNVNGVLDSCECLITRYCSPAAPNTVSATGGRMEAIGLPSLSLNSLVLECHEVRPSNFGVFFYGPFQTSVPFGDGFRCVGGLIKRINPPVNSGPNGIGIKSLNFNQLPLSQVAAGETFNFQYWYRDPQPVGYGYNLSDALEITFCL